MKKYFVLAALFIAIGSYAQTYIADKKEVSGTWSKSGSPYIINGEVIVPFGKTLNIKPGVVVKFKTGTERDFISGNTRNPDFNVGFLRVNGKLIAKGKKGKLVTFTRDGNGTWGNVFLNTGEQKSELEYCLFEYGWYIRGIIIGDNATGALTFLNCSGTVKNCIFANNGWTAFNCKQNSSPNFIHNTVYGNKYGFECNSGSSSAISNCIFWGNDTEFYVNGGNPSIGYSLYPSIKLERTWVDKGHNIVGKDPQFKDAKKGLFQLLKGSPAMRKANDGKNIGAF